MNEKKVRDFLQHIIGKKLSIIGRASNMLCIGIGETIEVINRKGDVVKKGEISLHIQSAWRIVNAQKKEILIAFSDFYSPNSMIDEENFDWENFDWDIQGNNLFDEKSQSWLEARNPIYVKKYELSMWGDLIITFSNNEQLQVFVKSSNGTEAWRIFQIGGEEHLVITGLGYQFE